MVLCCFVEREAAFRDVSEHSSIMSRLSGPREGQESFTVNVGHNAAVQVVGQEDGSALLGLSGGLNVRGVDKRLRRGIKPLQRHCWR